MAAKGRAMATLKLEGVPTWSEVEDFRDKTRALYRKKELSLRDFLILNFYPTTGMKTSEMLLLKKGDLNLQIGTARVIGKIGSREIFIMPSMIPYLKEHVKDLHDQDKVFKLTRRQALNINYKYTDEILGRRLRVEDWRHAFAIRMLETIKDPTVIRKMMGQKSSKMMKVYQQAIQRDLKDEVMRALGG